MTCNRPQQNGVAEHATCIMGDVISAMLCEAQPPPSLWGEALATQNPRLELLDITE